MEPAQIGQRSRSMNPPQDKKDSLRAQMLAALKAMSDYNPLQADFSVKAITEAQTSMVDLRDIEAQKQADLNAARDNATAAEWAFP